MADKPLQKPAHGIAQNRTSKPQRSARFIWLVVGGLVLLGLLGWGLLIILDDSGGLAPVPTNLSSAASAGKTLFLSNNCGNCHGAEGRRLGTANLSDIALHDIIRKGRGSMPANTRLSDEEINQIIAYFRALKPPHS